MSLWTTIKGWLGMSDVKVLLWKYTEPLSRSNPVIKGAALLKTKSPKTIFTVEVKVVEEFTHMEGEGEEKKQKKDVTVMGYVIFPGYEPGLGYPLELKPDANQEQPFSIFVDLTPRLQNMGGVLGGIGKLASLVSRESVEYFLIAEVRVKDETFKPYDKKKLKIGD